MVISKWFKQLINEYKNNIYYLTKKFLSFDISNSETFVQPQPERTPIRTSPFEIMLHASQIKKTFRTIFSARYPVAASLNVLILHNNCYFFPLRKFFFVFLP